MRLICLSLAVAITGTSVAQAQAVRINPGQWEYTTEMMLTLSQNGDRFDIPSEISTEAECVTSDEALIRVEDLNDQGCQISDLKTTATTLDFRMTCATESGAMLGQVATKVTDGGDGNQSVITLNGGDAKSGELELTAVITGRRTGACTPQ